MVGKYIEVVLYMGFIEMVGIEIEWCISIGKVEVFVYIVEIFFFVGKRNNVIRIYVVGFVSYIELMDVWLVGMCWNVVVWYLDSYLYGFLDVGIFIYYFYNLYFIGIGNGEWFVIVVIFVFLY